MRIRIVCKAPAPAHHGGLAFGVLASHMDTRVVAVADDGTESELVGVERISWSVANDGKVLEIVGTEIEAEGEVD